MKRIIYLIIICCSISLQIFAQSLSLYSRSEIFQDLDYLINDIENIHPDLYHSVGKEDVYKRIQLTKDHLPDSLSKWDIWMRIHGLLALFNEGHTMFHPPSEEIGDYLRFPLKIKIDDNTKQFIVTGTESDTLKTHLGDRIIYINGISSDSLIKQFRRGTAADNETFFRFIVESHIDEGLYTVFGAPEYFDIQFLSGGEVITEHCRSIKYIPEKIIQNYTFKIIQDSIGLIDMNSMDSFRDFKKFCKSTFKYLNKNKISSLIIDFRGNSGGNSKIGDELIKYLSDVSFLQYEKVIIKFSVISRMKFLNPLNINPLFKLNLSRHLINPYPESKRFTGNVYILIDGGTFSSAGSTVWCIDHYNIGTSIGEESGGLGVHFGHPKKRILPNTGLEYVVSRRKWYQIGADDNSTYGLIPDYKVELSTEDIRNNRDTCLEYAIKLINNN
jgi:hypothetical protein